ncbi:MAG TPA: molybdopterin cofactor-binding domain-containing protein, partial [Candidatus Dormibacteraeota bacterium]|nr:molybdopterin cofactor-binding domain-containing protein [Candidatus Dormibacteraeota bacterium]
MKATDNTPIVSDEDFEIIEALGYDFGLSRRSFVQFLGAGLVIAASVSGAVAQNRGRPGGRGGGGGPRKISARIHFGKDGSITVLVGKVEAGQGARTEMTQAAAEELRVQPNRLQLVMADTSVVPDDGITAGSGSTPRTMPAVRQSAAAARQLLIQYAANRWQVKPESLEVHEGEVASAKGQKVSYGDLAGDAEAAKQFDQIPSGEVSVTAVKEWKVLGTAAKRPNGRAIVSGVHKYPSDVSRPGLFYGKVLRAPTYRAKLLSVAPASVKSMKDVIVVQDEDFAGVVAPTNYQAEQAIAALAKSAKWQSVAQVSSDELYEQLKQRAGDSVPANGFKEEMAQAKHTLRREYEIPYVQHAPLEPRAAVAEWADGKLTVWAGTQNPFGHRGELARAFHVAEDQVRVVVPDFGGGFGGKHTGEASVEAARLAKGAGKPVSLRYTREEEFKDAYFRPGGVILAEASLDEKGKLTSWHFININSGPSAVETPYRVERKH